MMMNKNKLVQKDAKNIEPYHHVLRNSLDKKVLLLICLPAGFHNRGTIQKELGIKKGRLHYCIKRLLEKNLINEHRDQEILYYTPTKKGKYWMFKILSGYDDSLNSENDRAHDLLFKTKILQEPTDRKKWVEDGTWFSIKPYNRIDWWREIDGIRIQKTSKNLLFFIKEFYAKNSDIAIAECQSLVEKLIKFLLEEYPGLKLDPYKKIQILRQHHAMQNDEFAIWCKAHGIRLMQRTDNSGRVILQIDYSKNKIPETEFLHPKKSQDHFMRYDEMKRKTRNLAKVIDEEGEDFADHIVWYVENESENSTNSTINSPEHKQSQNLQSSS